MKVLQLNTEKTWRGGEKQTLYTILGLLQKGIEVGVLCRKNTPFYNKILQLQKKFPDLKIWSASNYLEEILKILKVAPLYDILHAQTGKTHTAAILTKPFHRKKVIYTRRVHFTPEGFLTKLKYKLTDKVIAISQNVKQTLNSAGIKCEEVIYSCIFPKELNYEKVLKLKNKLQLGNRKIIGAFSALVPHKDPFTLVKTAKELKKIRNDFVFLHFGEGELKEKVKEMIKKLKLEDVYYLMEFWEDVEDFFLIFDVFIITSSGEALGSSILDAFYYKVPVVASSTGGIKEVVENKGFLCPVGDYKCFAHAINILLENKELQKELTQKAYKFVEEKCSLTIHTEKYLKIYQEILK